MRRRMKTKKTNPDGRNQLNDGRVTEMMALSMAAIATATNGPWVV
jgi:hypothetical protein